METFLAECRRRNLSAATLENYEWQRVIVPGMVSLGAGPGAAVREFVPQKPHGRADYLLFVDRRSRCDRGEAGWDDLDRGGAPVRQVQPGSARRDLRPGDPLPFMYESTGIETRFTNLPDPGPSRRRVFAFHRPETMRAWIQDLVERPDARTLL